MWSLVSLCNQTSYWCASAPGIRRCRLKWEFPGGKIEEGEQPRDALRRELEEELGINATIGDEVARIQHEYPNGGMVELRFYLVREFEGELENRIFKDMHWANPKDLPEIRLPRSGSHSGQGSRGWKTIVDLSPAGLATD